MMVRCGCCVVVSLALYGCGADPSGTAAANRSLALSNYSGSQSGVSVSDGEVATSVQVSINGVALGETDAETAIAALNATMVIASPLQPREDIPETHLTRNIGGMAKAFPSPAVFRNVTSVAQNFPRPAY